MRRGGLLRFRADCGYAQPPVRGARLQLTSPWVGYNDLLRQVATRCSDFQRAEAPRRGEFRRPRTCQRFGCLPADSSHPAPSQ